jgi:putative thiamine transport system substrate-binding protein
MTVPCSIDSARRRLLAAAATGAAAWPGRLPVVGALSALGLPAQAAADWSRVEQAARGQTVYFNAWAGSDRINAYLQWAAGEVRARHGVDLRHVKITETAEVVQRVRTEKAAGRAEGSVDMLWINGENFLAMKREGLLFGPFAEQLPAYALVDTAGKPTTRVDFSEPVDGMEAPWGMAQLTFFGDARRVPRPPRDWAALLQWVRENPGRFTYPRPPQFHGTTFLKQVLSEVNAERSALYQPMTPAALARLGAPLWQALDALHPHLWRGGRQFPASDAAMRQMLADGELAISLSFNPNEAASEIAAGKLPAQVNSWQHAGGTIGNTHFLAIAFNARAKEGAQVVANFLLSPLAQARKADIRHWGDPTVLDVSRLDAAARAAFEAARAPGMVAQAAPALPEPHASWTDALEREWARRYSA